MEVLLYFSTYGSLNNFFFLLRKQNQFNTILFHMYNLLKMLYFHIVFIDKILLIYQYEEIIYVNRINNKNFIILKLNYTQY